MQWEQLWKVKLELRDVTMICYHDGMVMENLRNPEWGRQWD